MKNVLKDIITEMQKELVSICIRYKKLHSKYSVGQINEVRNLTRAAQHTALEGDARQILDPSENSSGK